jgi:hypothetical protein
MDKLKEDLLNQLLTKDIDLKGRRIINAGDSKNDQDYITQSQFNDLIARVEALEKKVGK